MVHCLAAVRHIGAKPDRKAPRINPVTPTIFSSAQGICGYFAPLKLTRFILPAARRRIRMQPPASAIHPLCNRARAAEFSGMRRETEG
jgi:hypothetical protein